MSAQNLFGTSAEQDDVASSVRKAPLAFAHDHLSPTTTLILSLMVCTPLTVASVVWCTR